VEGETRGFFVHVADISVQKQVEYRLMQSTELIYAQNEQLVSFANIVTHNLRSYSGNLASFLDFFQLADDQEEKDEIFKYLQRLSKAFSDTVANLTELVAVPNLGKRNLEQVDLLKTVENTISGIAMQIRSCKAQVRVAVDPDLRLVTNPAYLESIVLNLLTNALKYRRSDRLPIIEISAFEEQDEVYLNVKDNGLGMDLERDGHRLFRMNNTFHGNADAKGLGLFITKTQIESHGGRIQVESRVNQGSTFSVVFPSKLTNL